jgi:hypothetical protein
METTNYIQMSESGRIEKDKSELGLKRSGEFFKSVTEWPFQARDECSLDAQSWVSQCTVMNHLYQNHPGMPGKHADFLAGPKFPDKASLGSF